MISAAADLNGSTLLGGVGDDTINLTGSGVTATRIVAGAGNDIINFSKYVTSSSIVGGAGNDSITYNLDAAVAASHAGLAGVSNTYFFGSGGGLDTLSLLTNPPILVEPLTSLLQWTLLTVQPAE